MLEVVNSIKLYVIDRYPPSERSVEQWAEGMKSNVGRIIEKSTIQVPDYQSYIDKIADPASFKYADVINPAFVSKSGQNAQKIRNAHRANIKDAFNKFETNRAHIFEEIDGEVAPRYKAKIDQAKDNFSQGVSRRTLRFTGDRITGLGIAPRAASWLTGQNIKLRAEYDYLNGRPVNVAKPVLVPQLKAALVPRLVQSGANVVRSEMDPDIITDENTIISDLLNGFRDSAVYEEFAEPYAALKSHCGYLVENGQLYLRIQVVRL